MGEGSDSMRRVSGVGRGSRDGEAEIAVDEVAGGI